MNKTKTKILLLALACAGLSGCAGVGFTADAVDPLSGKHVGPAIVDASTGRPLATLGGVAEASGSGLAGIIGYALSSVLGVVSASLAARKRVAEVALDQATTAVETLKVTDAAAWERLRPLLEAQLSKPSEQLISKIQERV